MAESEFGRLFEAALNGKEVTMGELGKGLFAHLRTHAAPPPEVFQAAASRPKKYPRDMPFLPHYQSLVWRSGGFPQSEPIVQWDSAADDWKAVESVLTQELEAGWTHVEQREQYGVTFDQLRRGEIIRLVMRPWPTGKGVTIVTLGSKEAKR